MSEEKLTPEQLKLRELEAKKAALLEARAAKAQAKAEDPAAQAAQLEAELAFEAAYDAAVEKHGEDNVRRYVCDLGRFIFKTPHPAAFKKSSEKPGFSYEEAVELVGPCVVFPSLDAFKAVADKKPGLWGKGYEICYLLAGVRQEADAKK